MNLITLTCPHCGRSFQFPAVALSQAGTLVGCPHCKNSFKSEQSSSQQSPGVVSSMGGVTSCRTSQAEIYADPSHFRKPATLIDLTTDRRYKLGEGEGEYIVGRKDANRVADVPISTMDKHMSRHHVRIIVVDCGGYYIHYVRNERALNETYLDGVGLENDGEQVLEKGQILQLADTKLQIVDEE